MHVRSPSGPINVLVLNGVHQPQQQCLPMEYTSSSPSPTPSSTVGGICQLSELCSNASPPVAALPGHHTSTASTSNSSYALHTVGENKDLLLPYSSQDKPQTLEEFIQSILDASGDGGVAAAPVEVSGERESSYKLCEMGGLTSELLKEHPGHDRAVDSSGLRQYWEEGAEKGLGSAVGLTNGRHEGVAAGGEPCAHLRVTEDQNGHEGG